ncbi:MAG: DUF6485 family protein [Candidatus Woesearchaeota archaeon]
MECIIEKNKARCNCTYSCSKKGRCCECLAYHRANNELPACFFDSKAEKTYDRSVEHFVRLNS